ncbi:MAG: MFS transporter [Saccharofermentanales bacterium]
MKKALTGYFRSKLGNAKFAFENDRDFSLFIIAGFMSGVAGGINTSAFNNFLNDVYHLTATQRGFIEVPRELPGLLTMVVLASLAFLGDKRIAIIGMVCAALGMIGLGLFSPTYPIMLVFMMLLSLGMHIYMPIAPSIGMGLSRREEYGMRLGRYNAYCLMATIFGFGIVWFGFKAFHFSYTTAFVIAAFFYLCAGIILTRMKKSVPHHTKFKIIFRRKYTLYYILCIVNGARKQIFLTFAPWVLIQVFHLDAPVFAVLGVVIALISIFTRTIIGKAIDSKGERFILSIEAAVLFFLCIGYAYAADFFPASVALVIIVVCYILDNSMSTVEMARSTYLQKIAVVQSDVTHTLAAGTSLDHIVSMTIPVFGGMLWVAFGYKYVFIVAAAVALINLALSLKIKVASEN